MRSRTPRPRSPRRRARRRAVALVLAAVLVLPLIGVPAVGQTATPTGPETDNTVTRIQVLENGTARWSLQVRTRLETQADVERYEAFRERFADREAAAATEFRDRMTGVVANAANATGRDMSVTGVAVSTSIQEVPRRWGVVTYEVTWVGFAARDGDALVVGDVFGGGFFLADGDRLVVHAPEGYVIQAVAPAPDAAGDGSVSWLGRRDFADRHPSLRLEPATPTGASPTPGSSDDGGIRGGGLPWWALPVVAAVLVAVVVAAWAWRRRADGVPGSDDGGVAATPVGDTERVTALLESRGGRLRQHEIAEALEWSASKTSRVLSRMVDDGEVEKTRLGRENVIVLSDEGSGDGQP